MPARAASLLAAFLAIAPAFAQTTGVVGINDLTINSLGSGTTSCAPLCFPGGNTVLNFAVSAPLGAIGFVFINFCPCLPCQLSGPSNACVPAIPATACGLSNQSFDMDLSPPCGLPVTLTLIPNSAGVYAASIAIPPLPGLPCSGVWTISAQAMVFNGCGLGVFAVPGPFVLTQAFTINF